MAKNAAKEPIQRIGRDQLTPEHFLQSIVPAVWRRLGRLFQLTPQELEAAQAICAGHKMSGIARRLRCAPATAKKHVENLHKKWA